MNIKRVALLSALSVFSSCVDVYATGVNSNLAQVKFEDTNGTPSLSKEDVSEVVNDINILDFKSSDTNISKLLKTVVEKYFDLSIQLKEEPRTVLENNSDLFVKTRDIIFPKLVTNLNIKVLQDSKTKKCIFVMIKHPKLDLVPSALGSFYDAVFHYEPDENSDSSLDKKYDLVIKSHPNAPVVTFYYSFDYLDEAVSHGHIREFMKTNGIELDPSEFT